MILARSLPLIVLFAGCSFSTYDYTPCSVNAECRDAFGFGSVCGDEGFCETAPMNERCQTTFPEGLTLPVDSSTTLLIGTVFDHSKSAHVARYRSIELAAKQLTDKEGLEGMLPAVIDCDIEEGLYEDELDAEGAAVATATWLADTVGVPAIVGPASSSHVEAAYLAIKDFGTLMISPSATSPSLTALDASMATDDEPGRLWRTAPPDSLQGLAIATDMNDRGINKVAVIYQIGAYGEGLDTVFSETFADLGHQSVSFPFDNETARSEAITTAGDPSNSFDEVLFISSDTADITSFLITAGGSANYADKSVFLTDTARTVDVLTAAAASSAFFPNVRGTGPSLPSGFVYNSFSDSYRGYFGEEVSSYSYTAQSFDAAWMVFYGHAWAYYNEDGFTGTNIARGLRKLSTGGDVDVLPSEWPTVRQQFAERIAVNINGASGPLNYDPSTEETEAPIDVWVITASADGFDIVDVYNP